MKVFEKFIRNGEEFIKCEGWEISIKGKDYQDRYSIKYWNRKGKSLEEALEIIIGMINDPLNLEYWVRRGYTKKEARSLAGKEKSKTKNPLVKEYWILKGFTEEEAENKISEIQKERSPRSYKYYMKHEEMSEDDARKAVSEYCRKNSVEYLHNLSNKELRELSPRCKEFYLKRGMSEPEAAEATRKFNDNVSEEAFKERYGKSWKEERQKFIEKQSKSSSGKNNGMWGRSPINGAGQGVSGYYTTDYFRSLFEYFFMRQCRLSGVTYICNDQSKKKWPGKIVIPLQSGKNYIPDFIVNGVIVEIKNEYTLNSFKKEKLPALQKYCKEHDMKYGIYTEDHLDVNYMYAVEDFIKGDLVIDKKKIDRFVHTSWSHVPYKDWIQVRDKIKDITGINTVGWSLSNWKDKIKEDTIIYEN
jgi:hypothetical protein